MAAAREDVHVSKLDFTVFITGMLKMIDHEEPYIAPSSIGVVIRKRDLFYRPEWKGYTDNIDEAGRYDREVAKRHAAKVEGVTVHEISEFPYR